MIDTGGGKMTSMSFRVHRYINFIIKDKNTSLHKYVVGNGRCMIKAIFK